MVAALKYLSLYFGHADDDESYVGRMTDQFFERQLCRAALRIRARAHLFGERDSNHEH